MGIFMLVNCPKCGFSQPKDQYCAQCGVDIFAYKVPQKSSMAKFFSDPLIQLAMIVAVGIFASTFLYKGQNDSIQDRVTYLRGESSSANSNSQDRKPSSQVEKSQVESKNSGVDESQGLNGTTSTESTATSTEAGANSDGSLNGPSPSENPSPTEVGTQAASPGPTEPPGPPQGAFIASGSNSKRPKATVPFRVKVIYAEISQRSLEILIDESGKLGQFNNFGDYSAGIIPQADKRLSAIKKDMTILRTDSDPIELGKPLNWTLNYRVSDREPAATTSDLSYSTYVNLEDFEGQTFRGNLEIVRSHKESSDSGGSNIQKNNFPALFELGRESAFFMSGLGAHRGEGGKPEPGDSGKPDTEFIVLVQFERN